MSYDESMIKYYGSQPCKQFIRRKPIGVGYKMWLLNTTSGYRSSNASNIIWIIPRKTWPSVRVIRKRVWKGCCSLYYYVGSVARRRQYRCMNSISIIYLLVIEATRVLVTVLNKSKWLLFSVLTWLVNRILTWEVGTDLMDENVSRYKIGIKRKNGGGLFLTQLGFRREITTNYLKR